MRTRPTRSASAACLLGAVAILGGCGPGDRAAPTRVGPDLARDLHQARATADAATRERTRFVSALEAGRGERGPVGAPVTRPAARWASSPLVAVRITPSAGPAKIPTAVPASAPVAPPIAAAGGGGPATIPMAAVPVAAVPGAAVPVVAVPVAAIPGVDVDGAGGSDAATPHPVGLPTVPGTGVAADTCVVVPRGRIDDVLAGRPQGPTARTGDGRERDGGRFGGLGGLGRIGGGRRPF